jgi:MoxR-like ATPase
VDSWWIYQGSGSPHDGASKLPPPPPSRTFSDYVIDRSSRRRYAVYRPSYAEVEQANLALYLRRPLIVIGESNFGTTLAYSVAHELKLGEVLYWPITSRSTLLHGLYTFDHKAYEQDVRLSAQTNENSLINVGEYILLGPLGTAFLSTSYPRVIVIDDVDKADDSLLEDLSVIFEEAAFQIPELVRVSGSRPEISIKNFDGEEVVISHGRVSCRAFPFILLTSTGEKKLPIPLLKQCIGLQFPSPTLEELEAMIIYQLGEEIYENLKRPIHDILERSSNKYSTYQYIVDAAWMASHTGESINELFGKLRELEFISVKTDSQGNDESYSAQNFYGCYFTTGKITMSEEVNISQSGSFGVGVNQGTIQTEKLAGTLYEKQDLSEAASEIQSLLERLSESYPSSTTAEKMVIATQAIDYIENNSTLLKRVLSAIKAGGIEALGQALNHPASSFLIAAFEDWQKTKEDALE